jgi:hypothetical protein
VPIAAGATLRYSVHLQVVEGAQGGGGDAACVLKRADHQVSAHRADGGIWL